MDFSTRVRALREGAGLTQAELADKVGLTNRAVGAWESGRSRPRLDKLSKLADILGTTPYYLLNGDGPERVESHAVPASVPSSVPCRTATGSARQQRRRRRRHRTMRA